MRTLRDESRRVIAGLESAYRQDTGVAALKIKHNGVLGYFIEVTQQHADKLMAYRDERRDLFRHRQTMAGAVRFSTDELAIAGQPHRAGRRSRRWRWNAHCSTKWRRWRWSMPKRWARIADALAVLDVAAALAELAVAARHVRPTLDNGAGFRDLARPPSGGGSGAGRRHMPRGFVPNDCDLSSDAERIEKRRLWLVTGPNMAGKSTFLRQNALIAILAQMGSFVPADAAHIGIVDRLFSRVGAGDDLAAGRSTFMVEMVETAAILNQATARAWSSWMRSAAAPPP